MRKDLDGLAEKLLHVLVEIPDNFALENAKLYLKKAINEIKSVKIKREKRKINQQNEIQMLDYNTAKTAIAEIDRLIELEKRTLDKKSESNQELLSD